MGCVSIHKAIFRVKAAKENSLNQIERLFSQEKLRSSRSCAPLPALWKDNGSELQPKPVKIHTSGFMAVRIT
jgi:hypothetical protein